ncbi:MAG: amino acid ABC transporter permease [Lachnospiraceae bacterium]|nr:amino acid ABC transporter permease [Lachnospiraceae bacterium]
MHPFHPSYVFTVLVQLFPYIGVTLLMMLGTVIFGGAIGILLAKAKIKRRIVPRAIAEVYTYLTRCVPSIIMLFIVYYGVPALLLQFGININNFSKGVFVITAFSILFASNLGEVFRAAYLAVDPGQREAAVCSGLSEFQAFYRIILPQAAVHALPNFSNMLVNLMKEGALAYSIGLIDVMGEGNLLIGRNQGSYTLETYLGMAIIYWTLTFVIELIFGRLEKNLSKGKKHATSVA